jgi:hypothetical protein
MKKVIFSLVFALTFFTGTATFAKSQSATLDVAANQIFDTNVYVEPYALKLNVRIVKEVGNRVQIKIVDPYGMAILFHQVDVYEAITHTRIDLSMLENGTYQLIITDGETEEVRDFEIKTPETSRGNRGILLK